MENLILKKRLNTFKSSQGRFRQVSDEVIMELLRAWESWPGTSKEFYQDVGLSKQQLAILIKKGKKLVKSGIITESEFKEIKVENSVDLGIREECGNLITISWDGGKVIKFSQVDQLIYFLKKVS